MPEDRQGFATDVSDLDEIAGKFLPNVAHALRAPADVVLSHEGLEGGGRFQAVFDMEAAYAAFTDSIGHRQRVGIERIEATGTALREIVALYRMADGQG
ncbi:hypothetical protein [Actinokineospora sp. HUAS TT18]|uniref:hypothetical protein n=1 Tax=Actinokineospora sp. HUAS TT18 TaxID=3447451 RepID=UPI003F5252E5